MKLLLYKGTKLENPNSTLWDNLICFITRSRFSHVELSYYDSLGSHMCWSASTRDNGVRLACIEAKDNWEVLDLHIDKNPEWFFQHRYKPYDYLGLLGTIIKLPFFSSKNKWFCSEIIAEFLGLKDSWKYTPEDLYRVYK